MTEGGGGRGGGEDSGCCSGAWEGRAEDKVDCKKVGVCFTEDTIIPNVEERRRVRPVDVPTARRVESGVNSIEVGMPGESS